MAALALANPTALLGSAPAARQQPAAAAPAPLRTPRVAAASSSRAAGHIAAAPAAASRRCVRAAVATAEPSAGAAAMRVVEVDLGDRTYPIYIGRGLLDQGELLRKHIPGKTALIVTNETVAPLYLERCAAWAGLECGAGDRWG